MLVPPPSVALDDLLHIDVGGADRRKDLVTVALQHEVPVNGSRWPAGFPKSDRADAHAPADMVRIRRYQLRQVAADSGITASAEREEHLSLGRSVLVQVGGMTVLSAVVVGPDAGAVAADGGVAPAAVRPGRDEEFEAVLSLAGHEWRAGQEQVERGASEVLRDDPSRRGVWQGGESWAAVLPAKVEARCRSGKCQQPRGRSWCGPASAGRAMQEKLHVVPGFPQREQAIGIDGVARRPKAGPGVYPGSPLSEGRDAVAVA
ncbi:hypothetical protein GCM10027610_023880 [Dactylosporangium cerinum]